MQHYDCYRRKKTTWDFEGDALSSVRRNPVLLNFVVLIDLVTVAFGTSGPVATHSKWPFRIHYLEGFDSIL